MKKITKILTMLAIAITTIAVVKMPVEAAAKIKAPKPMTVYMDQGSTCENINVENASKTRRIKAVRSSDTSVLTICGLWYDSFTNDKGKTVETAGINFRTKKTGSANIIFICEGKKYSVKITVIAYKNPIKKLNVFGAENSNGDTNLAGEFATTGEGSAFLENGQKTKKISIEAASGWVIDSVNVQDVTDNNWNIIYDKYVNRKSKFTSAAITLPTDEGSYQINIFMYNKAKKIYKSVYLNLYN